MRHHNFAIERIQQHTSNLQMTMHVASYTYIVYLMVGLPSADKCSDIGRVHLDCIGELLDGSGRMMPDI